MLKGGSGRRTLCAACAQRQRRLNPFTTVVVLVVIIGLVVWA